MRVILQKDVGGVGRKGEMKDVADGYGLNFLIARGLATQATAESVKKHEAETSKRQEASEKQNAALAERIRSLDGKTVSLQVKGNEKGHLFKGVKKEDVVDALSSAVGAPIPVDTVRDLDSAIREAGEHVIHLARAGVEARVTLLIGAN